MQLGPHINLLFTISIVIGASEDVRSQEPKTFDRIFGSGPEYNNSDLLPEDGESLKHDTTTCSLTYTDRGGKVKWTKDLKPYGCRLIYFDNPPERENDRFDVVLQFENKAGYLLRSKTGKMKRLVLDQQR